MYEKRALFSLKDECSGQGGEGTGRLSGCPGKSNPVRSVQTLYSLCPNFCLCITLSRDKWEGPPMQTCKCRVRVRQARFMKAQCTPIEHSLCASLSLALGIKDGPDTGCSKHRWLPNNYHVAHNYHHSVMLMILWVKNPVRAERNGSSSWRRP